MPVMSRSWNLGFPTHWYLAHERTRMDAVIDASALGLSRCQTLTDRPVITTAIAHTIALSVDNLNAGKY